MNFFKKLLQKIAASFSSDKADQTFDQVATSAADETAWQIPAIALHALPFLALAAQIVVGLTPTGVDDAVLAQIRLKFPRLFDGTIHTPHELKAYALAVAGELVKGRFPEASTSVARSAAQLAFHQADSADRPSYVITGPSGSLRSFAGF